MTQNMRQLILLLTTIALVSFGCKKEPGEGGKAEIRGTVMRQKVNAVGNPIGDPYPYQDTRVYIVYGDHDFYDDNVRTGPNGQYVFRWLRKGDYTVYTYSECNCPGKTEAISHTVRVDGKKDVVTMPTITALDY